MNSFSMQLKLSELFDAFSLALDLAEGRQLGHARRTASIALIIAMNYGVSDYELNNLYYTAMLHDIGLSGSMESIAALEHSSAVRNHAISGAKIVSNIPYMESISPYIKYHHERWDGKGEPEGLRGKLIPLISRIINIADSIEIFVQTKGNDKYILQKYLKQEAGRRFDPDLVEIAMQIVTHNEFYETISHPIALLEDLRPQAQVSIGDIELLAIGNGFADLVDNKSPYTANHSKEVADFSVALATHLGYEKKKLRKIHVAALLHDIGKLGIPNKILHKPGKLTNEEYSLITHHPYYSELILSQVKGFSEIANWAALHHERLDGTGYHRSHTAEQITTEARIIAIADVFQAIISDRPYRAALPYGKVIDIMVDMANDDHLDKQLLGEFIGIAPALIDAKLEQKNDKLKQVSQVNKNLF